MAATEYAVTPFLDKEMVFTMTGSVTSVRITWKLGTTLSVLGCSCEAVSNIGIHLPQVQDWLLCRVLEGIYSLAEPDCSSACLSMTKPGFGCRQHHRRACDITAAQQPDDSF